MAELPDLSSLTADVTSDGNVELRRRNPHFLTQASVLRNVDALKDSLG